MKTIYACLVVAVGLFVLGLTLMRFGEIAAAAGAVFVLWSAVLAIGALVAFFIYMALS